MFSKSSFIYMLVYVYIGEYMYSTVRVANVTKEKIENLKVYKRESIDDVLNKLLALVPDGDEEGKYTEEFRAGLLQSLVESKMGKTYSLSEAKKQLGL